MRRRWMAFYPPIEKKEVAAFWAEKRRKEMEGEV
jgi:hypothetical protein